MKDIEKETRKQYNFILELLADVVKDNRKVSIKELSEKSGVSTAVISDFENRKYIPKVEILLRLFYALNINLGDLVETKEIKSEVVNAVKLRKKINEISNYENHISNQYEIIKIALISLGLSATATNEVMSYIKFKANSKLYPNETFK